MTNDLLLMVLEETEENMKKTIDTELDIYCNPQSGIIFA